MKKKKTIYLRKIRKRSTNKSDRYAYNEFKNLFIDFLNKVLFDNSFKSSFFKFLISFYCTSKKVVINIIKNFGFLSNFKFFLKPKKSLNSKILNEKFAFVNSKKYFLNTKNIKLIRKSIYKRLRKFSVDSWNVRFRNVEYKKKMTLYFSYRHLLELPVRGQRTKTNAKTRKNYNII